MIAMRMLKVSTSTSMARRIQRGGWSLSVYIWDQSKDLLEEARKTTFIDGVRNGDLDPNFYARYMLQVGLYCREVSRIWNAVMTTNKEGIDDEIKQFAKQQLVNTQTDKRNIYEGWNVTGIKAGSEVTKYINSVETSFHEYGPNVLISTYACAKLWPQLTCELKQVLENDLRDRNPYKVWVDANETFGSTARAQAQLMDGHKGFDHEKAHLMFRNAMQNEIDLFNRGGKAP